MNGCEKYMSKTYQAFNPKTKAWVKYKFSKETGFHPLDVKQRLQTIPFKGVTKRGRKR